MNSMKGTDYIGLAVALLNLGSKLVLEGNREATDEEVAGLVADSKGADAELVRDIADRRARDKAQG